MKSKDALQKIIQNYSSLRDLRNLSEALQSIAKDSHMDNDIARKLFTNFIDLTSTIGELHERTSMRFDQILKSMPEDLDLV